MPEDRSLDEFGGENGDAADDDSVDTDAADADAPTPATATATWTADGADCERCGERAERRWLDDGDRVCPECKAW